MRQIKSTIQEGSSQHAAYPSTEVCCITTQTNNKRGALRTGTIIFAAIGTFLAAALVVGTMGLMFYYVKYVRPNDMLADQSVIPTETSSLSEEDEKNFSVTDAATLPDQDGKIALSTIEIADKVGPATVSIVADVSYTSVYGTTETGQASGSGFIISSEGYIVTNNHVISGADSVQVLVPGENEPVDAVIVGTDFTTDIAVLKIDRTDLPYVILGDSDRLQVGELAVAIGNPFGELAGSVTAGVISALQRDLTIENMTYKLIQTDASINSGNSGGPLVNSFGEVIGVTNAKMSNGEGIGFAIPINDVKTVIEDLINSGYVTGRPVLGVGVMSVDEASAEQYGWPLGVYVREITKGGPADLAGIQIGDIITKIDGTEISSSEELVQIKNEREIGDSILITIYRSGDTLEYTVILQEEKPA
jgi:serine protease Do